jgi:hypothetical protein
VCSLVAGGLGAPAEAPTAAVKLVPFSSLVVYPAYPYLAYALPLAFALPLPTPEKIPEAEVYKERVKFKIHFAKMIYVWFLFLLVNIVILYFLLL